MDVELKNKSIKRTQSMKILDELSDHIVGQLDAKKALIIATNYTKMRSGLVESKLKDQIKPSHMIFEGPTGSGKSALVECHSKCTGRPYIKTEASKYTEVGYVGRDVDSMIGDLIEDAIRIKKEYYKNKVFQTAFEESMRRVVDILVGKDASEETRSLLEKKIRNNEIMDREIDIEVTDCPKAQALPLDFSGKGGASFGIGMLNISDLFSKGSSKKKRVAVSVKEAMETFIEEETNKLIDEDKIIREALRLAQEEGIIFIDEIDKIAARTEIKGEVNREGVQRDLLPLLDGSTVNTKYGFVKTHCILFIAAGAFHNANVNDLLPELQGRLPIRIKLHPLTSEDFVKILTETKYSLIHQYIEMFKTKDIDLVFEKSAILAIVEILIAMNRQEDIGARRLRTVIDRVLRDIAFDPEKYSGSTLVIDKVFVMGMFKEMDLNAGVARFIL